MNDTVRQTLLSGCVIPASPLALDADRRWNPQRQRALWRYYSDAGAGGVAVGVHTTQFAIRDAGLFEPLLELACEVFDRLDPQRPSSLVRVAGICGNTQQAVREATRAREAGFHCGLVSLAAWRGASWRACVEHCRAIAETLPVFGFYLQPAVGGVALPYEFWRSLLELPELVAIKVAPFDRYRTLDVFRAAADSQRDDVALYTGNDDNIVSDLVQTYEFVRGQETRRVRFVGGLLGQWACWTLRAVELLRQCHAFHETGQWDPRLDRWGTAMTDANAVIFDAANRFAGCIPGIHEVLRRQGLFEGTWCLDPEEVLSPGQAEELDRIEREYPFLNDDTFVAERLDRWLS